MKIILSEVTLERIDKLRKELKKERGYDCSREEAIEYALQWAEDGREG